MGLIMMIDSLALLFFKNFFFKCSFSVHMGGIICAR